jgi:hypothetical protein
MKRAPRTKHLRHQRENVFRGMFQGTSWVTEGFPDRFKDALLFSRSALSFAFPFCDTTFRIIQESCPDITRFTSVDIISLLIQAILRAFPHYCIPSASDVYWICIHLVPDTTFCNFLKRFFVHVFISAIKNHMISISKGRRASNLSTHLGV